MIDTEEHIPPDFELAFQFRREIHAQWEQVRTKEGGEDLAVFIYRRDEEAVAILLGVRSELIKILGESGLTSIPEDLNRPAHEGMPFHGWGLWVIIGHTAEDGGKRIAVTKFLEPVISGKVGLA